MVHSVTLWPVQNPSAAGIYCRMSLAVMNDPTKVEDQARISRELARNLGWGLAAEAGYPDPDGVYTDNSRSAWQKTRKRPAWNQMLADVEAGKIDAIIVYHGDRLVRQPFDLEMLINLAEGKGLRVAAPTGMRNLDNSDDRFVLRILVAQACMESDNTSRRRKSQYERWRREGKVRPGGKGGRAFGFTTRNEIVDAEAGAVRLAARMVLRGSGLNAICRELTRQGFSTTAGAEFTYSTLRKMLPRPRYAGLMPDGVSQGSWTPILDRGDWEAVRALLDSRPAGPGSGRRYLLSGIAVCGECGTPLQVNTSKGRGHGGYQIGYMCRKPGCRRVYRAVGLLDAYTGRRVVARLSRHDNPVPRAPQQPGLAAEFTTLTEARAGLAMKVTDPAQPHLDLLLARLDALDVRLARLREATGGAARGQLIAAHQGITWEQWEAEELGVRRSLVAACFKVEVLPASHRGPGFRPEDVRLTPR